MKQYTFITIGAGSRGTTYTTEMMKAPEKYKLVGMADPMEKKRKLYMEQFGLTADQCYESWEEILSKPKMADVAIIATIDNMHFEPAMRAIELGYNLLLEKPVANTERECVAIANAAKAKGVNLESIRPSVAKAMISRMINTATNTLNTVVYCCFRYALAPSRMEAAIFRI